MKLASCDFCPAKKQTPRPDCRATTIDGRAYDICPECVAARAKQLEGKGVQVADSRLTLRYGLPYNGTSSLMDNGSTSFYGIRPEPIVHH